MDEETQPDSVGFAYVATRRLFQATVVTALCPFIVWTVNITHAITKCNTE